MRRPPRRVLFLLAATLATAGLALTLLLPASEPSPSARREATSNATAATDVPGDEAAEATLAVHSTETIEAPRALASLAAKTIRLATAEAAGDSLERELARQPAGDLGRLRVRLERLLRDRPELAPGAARAFAHLEGRELAFVVARALATRGDDPVVRATLEQAAASGPADRREAAMLALPPDARTLALARAGFEDPTAAPTVRAASVYTLARGYDALSTDDKANAVASARALATAPGEDSHLRAEALHLVARATTPATAGADQALAQDLLAGEGASSEVTLAAARLALVTGADRSRVSAALARQGARECAVAASILASAQPGETPSHRRSP